jgi:Fe-S oxidoreductase
MTFSVWEKLILAIAMIASGAGFLVRFRRVVARIEAAKSDPDFSIHPLAKRIWEFFWEVICQAKVIKERPLPGLAHAFVFWGFCIFGLITINHFASGFGFPLLDNWLGDAYKVFAECFGLLVAISIAGLFIRRFIVRPKWLGELSIESGIIALLIFTLMLTFIGVFFFPEYEKPLWWAHTIALLAFLPLIPHTKHLHLVLSPVTVFLSRGEFSHIPPLVGDEDFGLDTGKDLTKLIALQVYSCVECGRCSEHCPAFNTHKILDPKKVVLGVRGYLNELGPKSEEPILSDSYVDHVSQEAAFQCTTCGSCEYQCPVGIEHLPIIIGLRRGAVNTGKWEDDYGTKLFLALERNGNALGFASSERDKFIQKQEIPIFDGSQEYCLWLGCMGGYDPQGREIIASFARVMQHLGTTFGVLRKERCTGDPARRLGNDLVFQQLAEQNLESLKQANVKKIVSICPHCVRTISTDWREFGEAPPIEHHSEFMARHIDKLPKDSAGQKVVYHDPCYLGRYRGVFDEPRAVAGLGGEVVDPDRARERSFCCGAGGGLAFLGEEAGDRVSHTRAKELIATGAQVVGAACPFCNTMFRDALAAVSDAPPKLMDIAQIAAAGLSK